MKVQIGDKIHEIETVYYPEQDQTYYDAVEREDWFAAHFLHISPIFISPELVQMRINHLVKMAELEEERKFAESLPPELLEVHIQLRNK